jgi:FtsZ-binding cell division protein ZapB
MSDDVVVEQRSIDEVIAQFSEPLYTQIRELTTEIDNLRRKLSRANESVSRLSTQIEQLQRENTRLKSRHVETYTPEERKPGEWDETY